MKLKSLLVLAAVLSLGMISTVKASPCGSHDDRTCDGTLVAASIIDTKNFGQFDDGVYTGVYFNTNNDTNKYEYWTHSFTFNPQVFSITDVILTLKFRDDSNNDKKEKAKFIEELNHFDSDLETSSYALNFTSGNNFDVDLSKKDTSLSFILKAVQGDFYLISSTLDIEYNYCQATLSPDSVSEPVPEAVPEAVPVPEPSTFLLLGAGLGGFALYRRRMRS